MPFIGSSLLLEWFQLEVKSLFLQQFDKLSTGYLRLPQQVAVEVTVS